MAIDTAPPSTPEVVCSKLPFESVCGHLPSWDCDQAPECKGVISRTQIAIVASAVPFILGPLPTENAEGLRKYIQ